MKEGRISEIFFTSFAKKTSCYSAQRCLLHAVDAYQLSSEGRNTVENERIDSTRGTALFSFNGFGSREVAGKKLNNVQNRIKKARRHGGCAWAEGFGYVHKVFITWTSTGRDTAVPVVQSYGDTVSCITAEIRRIHVSESGRIAFSSEPPL